MMTREQERIIEELCGNNQVLNVKAEPRAESIETVGGIVKRPYYFVQAFFRNNPWNLYEGKLYDDGMLFCQGHFCIDERTRIKIFGLEN